MTARQLFWLRVQARARGLTPAQTSAFMLAIETLKEGLGSREIEALIAAGSVDGVIALAFSDRNLDVAFSRYRARAQLTAQNGVAYFGKDIPGVPRGTIQGVFNVLSPKVVEAVGRLDTKMMQTLKADVRETARQVIRQGLESGVGARTTARKLREVIGLAPNQLDAVENYRRALMGVEGAGNPLSRALRDRRYDSITRRGNLTAEQVEKATAAYRRRMIAFNAETNARTATLESLKLGQELAWRDAIEKGFVSGELVKQWSGVMDDRERPEHVAMQGETVPFDMPYSNGETVPGDSTYNCRCLSIIFTLREAA